MTVNPQTGSRGPYSATHVAGPEEIPAEVLTAHREHFKCPDLTLPALNSRTVMNGYPRLRKEKGTAGTVVGYSHGTTPDGAHPYVTVYIAVDSLNGEVLPCSPECCYSEES